MIFSENKLREIANIPSFITTEQIVNAINSIGFEVESIEKFNKNKNLKFGHVLSVEKNPNSNKLNICKIKFNDKTRVIQTAAQNVKKDDFLIAFVPGSKFNNKIIKEKKLCGVVSEGMLVSFDELGFKANLLRKQQQENILIIEEVDLSLDPIEYFNLDDNLIDVTILTNRSDAQSYLILAKELAAYFHTSFTFDFNTNNMLFDANIKLEIETSKNIVLNGVLVKDIKNFKLNLKDIMLLLKSNIKSINGFEDFSSLIMLYTGIYPRIFDFDTLNSANLKTNEENDITYINDGKENVAILGIEVLNKFKPKEKTKNIFIEFSQIDQKIIRSNLKMNQKIVKPGINILKTISNGSILLTYDLVKKYFVNISRLINPVNSNKKEIDFDIKFLIRYAGFNIIETENYKNSIKSLEILNFKFIKNKVFIPNYRYDVETMQDVTEEIFRFYGLNNFEAVQPKIIKTNHSFSYLNLEKTIVALGYNQAWTYTLINEKKNIFNPLKFQNIFKLKTFVSEEYNSIRNSLTLPMLNVYEYNEKRKIDKLSLFDIGMINNKKALIISSNNKSYIEIKSDLEKITNQKFDIQPLNNKYLHPNYNAGLFLNGKLVGWIGKLNPFWIDSEVIFAEVFVDTIYKPYNQFTNYENNPLKERDVTICLKENISPIYKLEKIKEIGNIFSVKLLSTFAKNGLINWTYKIKMSETTANVFDKKIDDILNCKNDDFNF